MSMILMAKAMQLKVGNPTRKLVLLKLADNANDQGECWPSYQNIADHCEISRRSVIAHINALEEAGLLRKISRKGTHHGNASNIFVLSLDGEKSAPPKTKNTNGLAGENNSPPSEYISPPSEPDALGGSEPRSPRTSHSFEPVIEPSIVGQPDTAAKVIEYLNQRTGSKFKPVQSNTQLINARLKEGHSLETVIAVIDRKCAEWLNDPKMSAYLRPGTLFSAKNFNNYAGVIDKPLAPQSTQVTDDLNDTSWMNEPEGWL